MAFGALFRNPATGSVQIDESNFNFGLTHKGAGTTTGGVLAITVTSSGSPIIALETPYYVSLSGVNRSGTTWTYYYRVFATSSPFDPVDGVTVTYYVFDKPLSEAERPLPQMGMIVRHPATMELVFRSDQPPMVIVDYQAGSAAWESGIGPTVSAPTYPSGRTYAVSPTQRCGWRYNTINPVGWGEWELIVTQVAAGFRVAGNTLQCASTRYEYNISNVQVAPASFNYWFNPWGCMVVDVTGLS